MGASLEAFQKSARFSSGLSRVQNAEFVNSQRLPRVQPGFRNPGLCQAISSPCPTTSFIVWRVKFPKASVTLMLPLLLCGRAPPIQGYIIAMPSHVFHCAISENLLQALRYPPEPRSAVDLLAGLAQGQGAGLLPRAEEAFWRRKPCLAECHRSRRMRRRGEQSGRLGGYN